MICYRKDNVLRLWSYLLELLRARRMRLELCLQLQQNFQEMLYILDSMDELKMRLQSEDFGIYLQLLFLFPFFRKYLTKCTFYRQTSNGCRRSPSEAQPCRS